MKYTVNLLLVKYWYFVQTEFAVLLVEALFKKVRRCLQSSFETHSYTETYMIEREPYGKFKGKGSKNCWQIKKNIEINY